MKWIVVAILLMIVPYTIITLKYRRPGRAYEPYQNMRDRSNTSRLLSAGFQRISLPAERPADRMQPITSATINATSGALPPALRATLV
jgi:hypothetical protein